MSYEDDYDATEKVVLTNPEYWVEIKTCLSRAERTKAEGALSRTTVDIDGSGNAAPVMSPNIADYRDLMVVNSIVSWNLTGKDGAPWPVSAATVGRLKQADFDRIYTRVDALNSEPTTAEAQRFPSTG